MKISHKLTLVSSLLFAGVFLIVSVMIYISFNNTSKHIFYAELARTAKIAGMFYLEKDELSKTQYQPIEEAFYNLSPDQKISIYDEQDAIAFDTEDQSPELISSLDEIRQKETLNFKRGSDYYHGLFYEDNQGDFVVLVKAQSPMIQDQLNNLILILGLAFLLGMTLLVMLTSWLSKLAYKPVRHTIQQVNTLDLNQKPLHLKYKSTTDELEELFEAFNVLLKEIEQTYDQQKNFVDYASHELKTPLAGIISQLEVQLARERQPEEYRETSEVVLFEAERLRDILKNLLTFSSLNRVVHRKQMMRIDELLWEVLEQLSKKYSPNKFKVEMEVSPENSDLLEYEGNRILFGMALYNLLDNAAKFSDDTEVTIYFEIRKNRLNLIIQDRGIGMNTQDLKRIAQPFYRAQNATHYQGSGLGVSIALRILELHDIDFTIESEEGIGTRVILEF